MLTYSQSSGSPKRSGTQAGDGHVLEGFLESVDVRNEGQAQATEGKVTFTTSVSIQALVVTTRMIVGYSGCDLRARWVSFIKTRYIDLCQHVCMAPLHDMPSTPK